MAGINDVDILIGADSSAVATGLAELRNYGLRAQQQLSGIFAQSFAIGGFVAASKATIDYGARIYDLGQRFKVGTTELQQFSNAAEQNNVSLETLAMAFNRLDVAIEKARAGDEQMRLALANLNIKNWSDQSLTLSQAMLQVGSSTMNAASMAKVLGRNGTELRETLRSLSDGSTQLGEAMDQKTIVALKRSDSAFKSLWQGLRIFIGTGLLAPIQEGIDSTNVALSKSAGVFKAFGSAIKSTFVDDWGTAKQAWSNAGGSFWKEGIGYAGNLTQNLKDLGSTIKSVFTGDWSQAGKSFKDAFSGRVPTAVENITLPPLPEIDEAANEKLAKSFDTLYEKQEKARLAALSDEARLRDLEDQRNKLHEEYGQGLIADNLSTQQQVDYETQIADLDNQIAPLQKQVSDAKDQQNRADAESLKTTREKITEAQGEAEIQALIASGHEDAADRLKIELDYEKEIKDAIDDANEAWSEGKFEIAATNEKLAESLRLEKEVALNAQQTKLLQKAQQETVQSAITVSGLQGTGKETAAAVKESVDIQYKIQEIDRRIVDATAAHQPILVAQLEVLRSSLTEQRRIADSSAAAAVRREGVGISPGTDAVGRALAAGVTGVGFSDVARLMATDVTTGKVNQALYEQNKALQEVYSLQGKSGPWSSVEVLGRQKLLAEFYKQQGLLAEQQYAWERNALIEYYTCSRKAGLQP